MSHLYAIEFSTGLVKIGRAEDVERRIGEHAHRLSVTGAKVDRRHHACPLGLGVAEATCERLLTYTRAANDEARPAV